MAETILLLIGGYALFLVVIFGVLDTVDLIMELVVSVLKFGGGLSDL